MSSDGRINMSQASGNSSISRSNEERYAPNFEFTSSRKIRVHKIRPAVSAMSAAASLGKTDEETKRRMDQSISEIITGLAEVSLTGTGLQPEASAAAQEVRERVMSRHEAAMAEERELGDIFNMQVRHPGDFPPLPENWRQVVRPQPKHIHLSQYQTEMINYQRMLLRKNIWYYRDRMSVPRGPCPLHVLKDAWVQGVIDENTLVWGHGLYDWLPAKNVQLLLPMVRTPEVRLGAWIKRTFSLKPALNQIREQRSEIRTAGAQSQQVERMR